MKLSNRRTMYFVENEDENLRLSGDVQIGESGLIDSFNGNFYTLGEGINAGSFSYSETLDGFINKSVYSYPKTMENKGLELLDKTINELQQTN